MSYTTLPASRPAYSYDPVTRELLGTINVLLSPNDGTYPLPPSTVEFSPGGPAGLFQRYRLTAALDAWEAVPDYRYVMLYAKATAQPVANALILGQMLPDEVTTSRPVAFGSDEPLRNRWDEVAGTWRVIPDYSRVPLWEKATGMPIEPLDIGQSLPHELTPLPPPHGERSQWDEATAAWATDPRNSSSEVKFPSRPGA